MANLETEQQIVDFQRVMLEVQPYLLTTEFPHELNYFVNAYMDFITFVRQLSDDKDRAINDVKRMNNLEERRGQGWQMPDRPPRPNRP